ncbi:hypothetical protein A2765_03780 [Candidatus Kaiserbacteria bacterium RIFCSPHIGHO2_01_FULL_56_24]|uniref:DUF642 domain-containing protein n=1 Tax=Candidatus Kaiserbacteria bacterium RIFCSPHIGHO2_01_FULL_56_24 TaxID=1798487 RepID=A0A1F6DH15_9BACT|nr:MAG: hypothetical protein A2765_03780 [Candidatus Kaiserbacteria bacterium RIFCSPHIGHO2_01_FULL_56_24]
MLIVGSAGALATGTSAFFSDTETSTGNTFTAGSIDLLVDNQSYATNAQGVLAVSPTTSWPEGNLNDGVTTLHKFFDFGDIKPDDEGEDTISLHTQNDAYACMDVTLTSNDDRSTVDPETDALDAVENPADAWDGELAQNIQMFWWADDGDNVYEDNEDSISGGIKTLYDLATSSGAFSVALADSLGSIWDTTTLPADVTKYVAKAWCFGTLGLAAVPAGQGVSPLTATGVTCDGSALGNETQTDGATLDVEFRAVQARNNPNFLCEECVLTNTNVLFDGGFENPEVTNPAQWDIFPSPAGGWQVAWRSDIPATFGAQNRPAIANIEFHEGVLGLADEGDQYVELDTDWAGPNGSGDGEPASVTIYQDIATTPGATYQWSYAFAPRPNTPASDNRVEMRWGGVIANDTGNVAGGGGPIAWTTLTGSVVATTTTTRIQFTDLGTANSLGSFVDDFSLIKISCTPIRP